MAKVATKCILECLEQFWARMNNLLMEQGGWTNLEFKREARIMLQIWRNKFKTKKIRKEQETWNIIPNIIQNLILSYPNYLILSLPYPNPILPCFQLQRRIPTHIRLSRTCF